MMVSGWVPEMRGWLLNIISVQKYRIDTHLFLSFTRWWFHIVFVSTPKTGETIQFDMRIFFRQVEISQWLIGGLGRWFGYLGSLYAIEILRGSLIRIPNHQFSID